MSAQAVYDRVPLGSFVHYSDGTPRPPSNSRRSLRLGKITTMAAASFARLSDHTLGNGTMPASVTLHQGDFGSAGDVVLEGRQDVFSVDIIAEFHSGRTAEAWLDTHFRSCRRMPNSLISPTIAPPRKPGLPRIAIPTPCLTKSRPMRARDTIEGRAA